jgi:hypothetical protein
MNVIDRIIWVSLSFIPIYGALELTWRLATKKLRGIIKIE